jgi:hypothetical protein
MSWERSGSFEVGGAAYTLHQRDVVAATKTWLSVLWEFRSYTRDGGYRVAQLGWNDDSGWQLKTSEPRGIHAKMIYALPHSELDYLVALKLRHRLGVIELRAETKMFDLQKKEA